MMNMTESARADLANAQNLKFAMARYHLALESAKAGTWEWDLRTGENFWSKEIWALYKLTPNIEKPCYDAWLETVHPDDRKKTRETVAKAVENESALYVEYRLNERHGKDRWVLSRAQPIKDSQGKVERYIGVLIDISEYKQAEEAQKLAINRFKLLSETTAKLLSSDNPQEIVNELCTSIMNHLSCDVFFNFLVDKQSGRLRLNAYAGIPAEEAERIRWLDYGVAVCGCVAQFGKRIHAKDIQNIPDKRTDLVKSYGIQAYACHPLLSQNEVLGTVSFGTKSRKTFSDQELELMRVVADQVSIAMQKILNQQKLVEYATNMEEIAKRITDKLKDAERLAAIGATAGMVGHDIRNPLQAIVSDLFLLKQALVNMPEVEAKAEIAESLEGIEKNVFYIDKIVADLQDYARPLKPDYVKINLADIVWGTLNAIAIPSDVKLTVDMKPLSEIKTDPTYIRRALTNLVTNAIQAMPTGGELTISGFEAEGNAFLTVSDTGVGIPEDIKPKLFKPMMTTKSKGQGFGLSVVKRLIEAIGGSITFESEEGKGTKFSVILPIQS